MRPDSTIISRLTLFTYKNAASMIVVILLLVAASIISAKKLALNADLSALLPNSFASVQDLEEVKAHFGGIGYVVLVVSGAEPDALRMFADEIAPQLKTIPDVSFVDYRRPVEFFQNHALYFLEPQDLKVIQKRITKRWRWEKKKRNPMYIDLEESEPPSIEFEDLQEKYADEGNSHWFESQKSPEPYYFNKDLSKLVIFVKPKVPSSDLAFSKRILNDIQQKVDQLQSSDINKTPKVEFTGRYQKKIDLQNQMQKDLGIASSVAFVLVIFYLIYHFKRIQALFLVIVPLLIGISATFGFTALVFGELNILSAFIGVILMGLGIDHGIHLLARYQDEQGKPTTHENSLIKTFANTGRSVAIAAFTTFVIFVGLGLSEFKAFHEFGVIAAAGMLFIMGAYLFCMPPLLKIMKSHLWREKKKNHVTVNHVTRRFAERGNWILGVFLCVLFISIFKFSEIQFNYDFESLANNQLRSFQLDHEVNELLGYSQTPMVALTQSKHEEAYVSQALRSQMEKLADKSGVDFLLSTSDLVPTEQEEKHEVIKKIAKVVHRVKLDWLEEKDQDKLQDLKTMVDTGPYSYSDLPEEIQQLFGDNKKQNEKGAIMLFPGIALNDGQRVMALADEIRNIKQSDDARVVVAGESMILADILDLVFNESPKVLLISFIAIFSIVWLYIRRIDYTVICLLPATLTIVFSLGILSMLGITLNYINIIVIPILLGIGVDSGIHMMQRFKEGETLDEIVDETGMAIFGSIVTTGLGFSALLLTDHAGLNSLAVLALIGLAMNLLVSLLLLPAIIKRLPSEKNHAVV